MLKAGLSVNAADNDYENPLLWACKEPNNIENITVLLQHGADINRIDKVDGAGVLHYATVCSDINTIEFLLKKVISVNVADNDNKTPLLWACQELNNVEIV